MAKDDRPSRKVKDNGNTESKKKNASPASISGSTDTSGLRRSVREIPARKQTTTTPDSRKSKRIVKQTPPNTPPIKKKSEKTEKEIATPLRRSDRSKKQTSPGSSGSKKLAEVSASSNIKSKKEKVVRSLKECTMDFHEDSKHKRQNPDVGGRKRKRMAARVYKALFKPQRKRLESVTIISVDSDACANSKDNHISDTSSSSSSGGKRLDHIETSLVCSEERRVNGDLKEQQELDSCDKAERTCKAAGVMETAEKNDASTMSRKETSPDSDMDSDVNICSACKLGGQLRCCDAVGCKRRYHLHCLDPPLDNVPLGIWRCPVCLSNIKTGIPSVSRVAESIWDTRELEGADAEGLQKQKQYLIKYKGLAHIHNQWVTETQLLFEAPLLVTNSSQKDSMKWEEAWTVPHKLLGKRLVLFLKQLNESHEEAGKVLNYHYEWLVKWQGLDYEQATWESEDASVLDSPKGRKLIKKYENDHAKGNISASETVKMNESPVKLPKIPANSVGTDNFHLSYVMKLHGSRTKGQSSIVFDNQERAMRVVLFLMSLKDITQPFLIITTSNSLSQWETMFLTAAPCNDFKVSIEDTEDKRSVRLLKVLKESGQLVFQVLLYPVDAFVKDLKLLKRIKWESVLVDESQCSEISTHFNRIKRLSTDSRLLLFCGPLGENVAEFRNVLSLLGCDGASPTHMGPNTEADDGLGKLKESLSRYIAYECKSDSSKFIEFWVPVQLSNVQLEQYCHTLLSNAMALRSCSKSDTFGALHDILISNRKCCDHPYIGDPLLQSVITKDLGPTMLLDVGIKASSKLHFLDLILPEMKKRQLRVLILYQPISGSAKGSASVGDILDDFVHQRFGPDSYERVDGVGIVPSKKQAALNNFNKDLSRFVFLLEYRACLSSIKLSSIDAVVIFDSDWNPANDLRALQKMSIDSQSEKIMVFRLYTSCTLEEKILRLAEHNVTIDSKLQNISRSSCDALLMWGASHLFDKLTKFHRASYLNISSEEPFMNKLLEEFLDLISHKSKRKDTSESIITRVQQGGGSYGKSLPLPSELKTKLPDEEQPHIFWRKLLDGRDLQWKFMSESTPRQRKRPQYFEDSFNETKTGNDDVGKKRKKSVNNNIESAASKPVIEEAAHGGASGVPADNGSQSSLADSFWSAAVRNERSLHDVLKTKLSKLCKVLKLSEDVRITVERFLEYVVENYRVNKEPTNTLQAFLISLCWIGSSLSKHKIDRRESFALAKKHLNFVCKEEEANSVYSKLEPAKEMFLRHTENQKKSDASKDSPPPPPPQRTDNYKSSNEETVRNIERLPNKCKILTENLDENTQKEIENINREWDEKRLLLVNDYNVDMAVIRTLYSNPSLRSEKLKLLEKELTDKLEEHERMRNIHLKELKATQLAAEGQMADNCNSNGGSDKENSESLELVADRIEDQPNNAEVTGMVFEQGPCTGNQYRPNNIGNSSNGASNIESTSSHTSEKHMADATVSSVPSEEIPSQRQDLGHVDSVGIGIPALECQKENEGTFSPDEDQNEIDLDNGAIHVDSVVSGEPNVDCNKENTEASTRNPNGSRVVEDQNHPGGSRTSSSSNSPSAAASQEKSPSVQQFVSPATDHSVPTVLESRNERFQLQPCNGIQDNEGQHNPNSLAEVDIDNRQSLDAGQVDQFNLENSSLERPEEPSIPSVAGDQSEILPANGVHSADSVHHQPSDEPPNTSQNREPPSQVAENAAEIPNPAALLHEPNLLNFQGPDNYNQVASRMPNHPLSSSDPLQFEMGRLCELKDNVIKSHEETKLMLKSECEKELAEMIAQINRKYEAKRQDAEAAFQAKAKELDINLRRVAMNKILAEAFRSKCQDLALPGNAGMQQVSQAGLLQQLHRFSTQPFVQRSPAVVSSSTVPQPPQIVHQPAALFSTTPSRPPPVAHPITPSTTSARPPPTITPITPYNLSNRPSPDINHTRPPPITATSAPSRPPPTINSITPSGGNLRRSGEIRAPAPHIRPFRPSVLPPSSSVQPPQPPPPVAPQTSSQPPSPQHSEPPPLPPGSAPSALSRLPSLSPLPSPRASSLPPTPVAAQPPPPSLSRLPSLPQMPPPQPPFPFPSEHHPPTTLPAASSSLPQIPPVSTTTHTGLNASAMPENRGVPPLPTSVNLALLDLVGDVNNQPNLRSNVNVVDLTEVRAQSSSAHDVVCLSDDD